MTDHHAEVLRYANDVVAGSIPAGAEIVLSCKRFLADLEPGSGYELRRRDPDFVIGIIEQTIRHKQGTAIDGKSLAGKPLLLQAWQKYIVYNLLGIYRIGTNERKYTEAFIEVPRKNGKTSFVAALAWGVSLLRMHAGASVYIAAASLRQAMQSFEFLRWNIVRMGEGVNFRLRDNSTEHSIYREFGDGSLRIEALAASPDRLDSLNGSFVIVDELHALKNAAIYNRLKEATKAYGNQKLVIGITTAGDNVNSFCYQRQEYVVKVLSGQARDESLFGFIARADKDPDSGAVDYTNPIQHQKANPSYGVTIRAEDMAADANQAANDPQMRKDFLSRSLDIYTTAMLAYFDLDEVKRSDALYTWTVEELAKLPVKWYGGTDLSRVFDLTAACLYGTLYGYKRKDGKVVDVDIVVPHAWFPRPQAQQKADEDNIPLFGWEDDGDLTLCNAPTVQAADVVKWYKERRSQGFKIAEVGHDRKFAKEYWLLMKQAKFNVLDQPQYYYMLSDGFRHIEAKIKNREFYYVHSAAFEYCIANVRGVEKSNQMILYEKYAQEMRIDIFDAAVMACVRHQEALAKNQTKGWW